MKEEFFRFDRSPLWQIHENYFKEVGIRAWSSGEIPYSGISNYNEAFKKAKFLISNFKYTHSKNEVIRILEIGAGFGEFAKNFLIAFKEISDYDELGFFERLEYVISDYSNKTLEELKDSKRLKTFANQIHFVEFDALDKFLWKKNFAQESFDAIMANYLLDQLPARIFVKDKENYYEKYISIESQAKYKKHKPIFGKNRWIKKLKKKVEFKKIDLRSEINLEHRQVLETCFRTDKASTVVYSYGALKAVKNFMYLLKPNGIIICSDFNASTKPGYDDFEPCYYGNSLAQAVNFEFLFKYFAQSFSIEDSKKLSHKIDSDLGYQEILIYEDPIKPLHTLILTRPDYEFGLELGSIYKSVYQTNWFLRSLYRFLVEMQLSFYLFVLVVLAYLLYYFLL